MNDPQENANAPNATHESSKDNSVVNDAVVSDESTDGRRAFLRKSIKTAAFVAPVVMFFKPSEAVAGSGGSLITPGP